MTDRNQRRAQIIILADHTSKTQREIAEAVGTNQSTVQRVLKQYRETGDFTTSYENCGGHNKIFEDRDLRHIRQLCVKSPKARAQDIKTELGAKGEDVSLSTMKRALIEAGCKTRSPAKRPFLTDKHKEARLKWAFEHREWTMEDWKKVVWSDETMVFADNGKCRYVRVIDGHPLTDEHFQLTKKFPIRVMFWSCFSWYGTGRMHVVEDNMDSTYYIKHVIEGRVRQQMLEWFPDGSGVFQQDNAPCHTSRRTKACLEQLDLNIMTWPAQSPDLNPIENLWGIVKYRLRDCKTTSRSAITSSFVRIWNRDEEVQAMCKHLVESMPRRVASVIESHGGHTKY